MTGKRIAFLEGSSPHTEDTVWFIEKTSAKDTSSPHTEDTVPQKGSLSSPHRVFPAHGGCRPDKSYTHTAGLLPRRNVVTNGRVKVHPNLYARGDCRRPCRARRRSVKREPL